MMSSQLNPFRPEDNMYNTSQNNFGIKNWFQKYFKESVKLASDEHFSVYQNKLVIKVSPT